MKHLLEILLRPLIHRAYPQFKRQKGYSTYRSVFCEFFIMQKIIGFNRKIPWPVHFTSVVRGWEFIEKGICCDPGDNIGVYINATGGLKLGNNVGISSNTTISTVNHDKYDHRKAGLKRGITIGNNVWIASNCVITAGVTIGDNVTVGAGCVIRQDIPSNVTVVQANSCLEYRPKHEYEWDCTKDKFM
ncbi:MAG: acyltransferase [Dysgonamonadaceae bacterium]|jgi:acetyltransferase-like isoleucine patch superfamily enzyme|nr:acyltransferase [Dysgonamonadaceae bacterium]